MKKFYWMVAIFFTIGSFSLNMKAQSWPEPMPVGSPIVAGSSYYVFNVGTKQFLDRGGEWNAHAIVFPSQGSLITVLASESLWILQYEAANRTLFRSAPTDGWTFTDNNAAGTNTWNIVSVDAINHRYTIQSPTTWAGFNANEFLGASPTLVNSNTGTVHDVRYNRPLNNFSTWMFCTPDAVAKFNAQVRLDQLMRVVQLIGINIDLSTYIQIYTTGTAAEILTAATNLQTALAPVDQTASIVNPTFASSPATGWTATAGFAHNFQIAEYFSRTFDIYQNVTGLAPGVYALRAQGFERPAGISTSMQSWFANGWDVRSSRLYATVSGNTTYVPVRSLYSETSSPTGSAIGSFNYPNSMSNANDAFNLGLYDNEVSYFVVDATGTARIGINGTFRNSDNYSSSQWLLFDNFRLLYYGPLAIPNLTVTTTSIFMSDVVTNTATFNVTGSNVTSAITITAPATGVSLSGANLVNNGGGIYTIANAHANTTNTITVVWDGVNNMNASISIAATGVNTHNIALSTSKDSGCFAPLYPSRTNLVSDPYFNSIPAFWGNVSLVSGAEAFCGNYSAKITGTALCWPSGGSISTPVITWNPNSMYRFRAMVKTMDGTFNMGVQNANVGGVGGDFNIEVPHTNGQWVEFSAIFVTGPTPGSGVAFFNNCGNATGMVAYIDNWELYDITDIFTGNATQNQIRMFATHMGDMVRIHGTNIGETVRIYSTSGQLVNTVTARSEQIDVRLRPGIYVVRANERVIKVMVK